MRGMTTEAIITKDPMAAIPAFWDGYWVCCFPQDVAVIPGIIRIMTTVQIRITEDVRSPGHEIVFQRQSVFAR
jgi:hypothetical protein